eukprot:TRINITY_DN13537_c0_g1_i1.p1 TRINITY_DN13537_c0_g1~~TRINITY_DN13537_c0_g1_i1.p1  ORF type:complete len:209 (-),score=32.43 TRINITY_DN13537_c0_g1_i1:156-758(-)
MGTLTMKFVLTTSLVVISSLKVSEIRAKDPCLEESGVQGGCKFPVEKWTFVKDYGCYNFQWSGCGGNSNKFRSKEECLRTCDNDKGFTSELSLTGVMVLEQNNKVGTLETLGEEYSIKFELFVDNFPRKGIRNVIGFTRKEGKFTGLMYVSVRPEEEIEDGVYEGGLLTLELYQMRRRNIEFKSKPLKTNQWIPLEISQH